VAAANGRLKRPGNHTSINLASGKGRGGKYRRGDKNVEQYRILATSSVAKQKGREQFKKKKRGRVS